MIFTYVRRELLRRRKAQLVIALGLALGIALVVVVNAVSSGMSKAQDEVLESLYGLGTDMTVSKKVESPDQNGGDGGRFEFECSDEEQSNDQLSVDGFTTLKDSTVQEVADISGVKSAAGGLMLNNVNISGSFSCEDQESSDSQPPMGGDMGDMGGGASFGSDSYTVYGTDVTEQDQGPLSSTEVSEGRAFKKSETNATVALVDSNYATSEDLSVGDTVKIKETKFEIVGIVSASSGDSSADVYIPLERAQKLSDNEDKVSDIYVQAKNSQNLDSVKKSIENKIDSAEVTTSDDMADTVSGSLSTAADLADSVGKWLSWIVLATSFLVAGMMASSAVSRRVREFGTLKALGWTRGRVTGQVMTESLITSLFGGAIGLVIGLLASWVITAIEPTLTAEVSTTASTSSDSESGGGMGGGMGGGGDMGGQTVDIGLTAPVSASMLTIAVVLAVVGGLIAGAFAASRASRLRPADAFRRVA